MRLAAQDFPLITSRSSRVGDFLGALGTMRVV